MKLFTHLPTEMLSLILFNHLSIGDLIATSAASKTLRSVALDFHELSRRFTPYYGTHPFLQEVISLQKQKKGAFESNGLIAICKLARISWNIEAKPLTISTLNLKIDERVKTAFMKLQTFNLAKPTELILKAQNRYLPSCIGSYIEIETLRLDKSQVTALPRSLKALTHLKKLSIEGTAIEKLPIDLTQLTSLWANNCPSLDFNELGAFSQLQLLSFAQNPFTPFDQVFKLTTLKILHLGTCQLSALPYRIRRLYTLEEISLNHNQFTDFPLALLSLKNLKVLDLSQNKIAALPKKIDQLCHLRKLYLSQNTLSTLPRTLGNLSELTLLMLNGNRLQRFPRSIVRLTQLSSLLAGHNDIVELPPNLEKISSLTDLILNHNRLRSVPKTLTQMTQLKELWLNHNALTELPEGLERLTRLKCLNVSGQKVRVPDEVRNQLKNTLIAETRSEE